MYKRQGIERYEFLDCLSAEIYCMLDEMDLGEGAEKWVWERGLERSDGGADCRGPIELCRPYAWGLFRIH